MLSMDQPDFSTLFNDELTTVPTSLFKDSRNASTKSALKNKLKVEVSSHTLKEDVVVIGGGGMLDSLVYCRKEDLVEELVNRVQYFSLKLNHEPDAYLLFDRYLQNSIKSNTRLK